MRTSTLGQVAVLACGALGAMAASYALNGTPGLARGCPAPSPAGIEQLFAPCQTGAYEVARTPDWQPSPPPEPLVARRPTATTDVDVTGSVGPR